MRTPTLTKVRKFIKGKVGLLELANQLGNVSRACKMLGYIAQRPMWSGETTMASSSAMNPRSISTAITGLLPDAGHDSNTVSQMIQTQADKDNGDKQNTASYDMMAARDLAVFW
jgi:hypothetical protein